MLVEDASDGAPASRAQLDAWVSSAGAWHTYTLDGDTPLRTLFNVGRDHSILVDLLTMKVVEISSDISSALSDLEARL